MSHRDEDDKRTLTTLARMPERAALVPTPARKIPGADVYDGPSPDVTSQAHTLSVGHGSLGGCGMYSMAGEILLSTASEFPALDTGYTQT